MVQRTSRWVPREFAVEKLLPVYLTLAEDEIWGVRKACAESLFLFAVYFFALSVLIVSVSLLSFCFSLSVPKVSFSPHSFSLHCLCSKTRSPCSISVCFDFAHIQFLSALVFLSLSVFKVYCSFICMFQTCLSLCFVCFMLSFCVYVSKILCIFLHVGMLVCSCVYSCTCV